MSDPDAPFPVPDPDTAGFWAATDEGRLALCRCVETGTWLHPPQERGPTGGPVRFEEISGLGTVFSYIVVRRQAVPGHPAPYVIGLVELDEQPGLRLNGVLDADPEDVRVGARARARLDPAADGRQAPRFELLDDTPA